MRQSSAFLIDHCQVMFNLSTRRIPKFDTRETVSVDTVKSCLIYQSDAFLILPLLVYVQFILIFVILSLVLYGIHVILVYCYIMISKQK